MVWYQFIDQETHDTCLLIKKLTNKNMLLTRWSSEYRKH